MAEVEFGGLKFSGGKMIALLTALSTLGGAAWGGFEIYKDYMDMKEIIQNIDTDAIAARNDVIETKLDEAIDYTRDIKSGLKDDIFKLEQNIERMEDKVDESERRVKDTQSSIEATLAGVREDLNTNGGELYYANGTEYIGLYHIHPEQGPMVGAKHSELPHSKLYYTSQLPKIPGKEYEDFISNYSPNTGFRALTCYRCIKTPTGQNQVVGFIPKDKNLGCGKNNFTDYNLAVQSCNTSQVRNPEIINESPSSTPAQQVNEAPSTRSIPNIAPSSGGGGGY